MQDHILSQIAMMQTATQETQPKTALPSPIRSIIESNQRFLVASHANPDGDALGSAAALAGILRALGKDVRIYNTSGVPGYLEWLPLPCPLVRTFHELGGFSPEWVIVLDCGEVERTGPEFVAAAPHMRIVNIDHHLDNPMFGEENWVDPSQAAVGCMVAEIAKAFDIPLSGNIGEAVYLALVSDTGYFSYGNTSPQVMLLAAEILRQGLDAGAFTARAQNQWSLKRMRLWSLALAQAKLYCNGAVGVLAISQSMLEKAGAGKEDCEGLVETIRRVRGVRMAITLREEAEDHIRISLRSHGQDNVQEVARQFGGGGHRNASGATFVGPLHEAEAALVTAAAQYLDLPATACEVTLGG